MSMDLNGCETILIDVNGCEWISIDFHGFWGLMDLKGCQWMSVDARSESILSHSSPEAWNHGIEGNSFPNGLNSG